MTMLSGKYWIGDLCYVMHDEWKEVCELIINEHTVLDGEFNLKDGRRFAIYSTAYGDGSYNTNVGTILGVDSGSIGCIKLEDIDQSNLRNNIENGAIVEFDSNFKTSGDRGDRNWDGIIKFGHVEVYTDFEEIEEYDNYYDEEEEEDVR